MEQQFAELVKQIEAEFPGYVFDVYIAKWKQLDVIRCGISIELPAEDNICPTCGGKKKKGAGEISVVGHTTLAEALAEIREKMKGVEAA